MSGIDQARWSWSQNVWLVVSGAAGNGHLLCGRLCTCFVNWMFLMFTSWLTISVVVNSDSLWKLEDTKGLLMVYMIRVGQFRGILLLHGGIMQLAWCREKYWQAWITHACIQVCDIWCGVHVFVHFVLHVWFNYDDIVIYCWRNLQ